MSHYIRIYHIFIICAQFRSNLNKVRLYSVAVFIITEACVPKKESLTMITTERKKELRKLWLEESNEICTQQ